MSKRLTTFIYYCNLFS